MVRVLDSTRALKRFYKQTFEVRDSKNPRNNVRHTMLLNPDNLNMSEPARVSVDQTLGGAYVTDFGQGIFDVTISGGTGYGARANADGIVRDGYTEFKHFRDVVYRNFIASKNPNMTMYWYNWEDEDYYRIQPLEFRLARNKSEPTLYRYDFHFNCLEIVSLNTPMATTAEVMHEISVDMGQFALKTLTSISNINELLVKLGGS